MLQNITKYKYPIHGMLGNATAELTECYQMICKQFDA